MGVGGRGHDREMGFTFFLGFGIVALLWTVEVSGYAVGLSSFCFDLSR